MLTEVTDGVLIHVSEFMRSNAVVVHGRDGVLLVDPGITADELACLATDLDGSGQAVVAGFSTHPHWDHLLWHELFGAATRYGTATGAAAAEARLSAPGAMDRVASMLPPEFADRISLDGLGGITGLPDGTVEIPWDGPRVRIVEHSAHAPGHAALLVEERGVLIAGDMLSDVLVPMLDLMGAASPIDDYLAALQLLEDAAGTVDVVVPGHGTVARGGQVRERIDNDRAYLHAMRDGVELDDPRFDPRASATS